MDLSGNKPKRYFQEFLEFSQLSKQVNDATQLFWTILLLLSRSLTHN